MAEDAALQVVRRQGLGNGFDGVLLVPAFLEAGVANRHRHSLGRIDPGPGPGRPDRIRAGSGVRLHRIRPERRAWRR
jgi:hypothetical protein